MTNGADGAQGATGATPVITATGSVSNTTGTPAVTITKTGTAENPNFDFAFTNIKGANGANGQGVPTGGTAGQVLSKVDGTDYNTQWINPPSGGGGVKVATDNVTSSSTSFGYGIDYGVLLSAFVNIRQACDSASKIHGFAITEPTTGLCMYIPLNVTKTSGSTSYNISLKGESIVAHTNNGSITNALALNNLALCHVSGTLKSTAGTYDKISIKYNYTTTQSRAFDKTYIAQVFYEE